MPQTRLFTVEQMVFAAFVVGIVAALIFEDKVSSDAGVGLISGIAGAILGGGLAAKSAVSEARANGIKEGAAAATADTSEPGP
jgi:hypothetical protein